MDAIRFNSSGTLYGATGGTGSLYTINPATGVATLVRALVGASNASVTYGTVTRSSGMTVTWTEEAAETL